MCWKVEYIADNYDILMFILTTNQSSENLSVELFKDFCDI